MKARQLLRTPLKVALAGALILVLLASAQGTGALWRGSEQIDPGTVRTGSLSLAAGNGVVVAKNYPFVALGTTALAPGGFVQAPLVISNTGKTALNYTLAGAASTPAAPIAPADVALGAAARLTIHASADAAACMAGTPVAGAALYAGPLSGGAAFTQRQRLAAPGGGTAQSTLCVRVSLPGTAPQAAAGGRLALTLTFRGDQE